MGPPPRRGSDQDLKHVCTEELTLTCPNKKRAFVCSQMCPERKRPAAAADAGVRQEANWANWLTFLWTSNQSCQ